MPNTAWAVPELTFMEISTSALPGRVARAWAALALAALAVAALPLPAAAQTPTPPVAMLTLTQAMAQARANSVEFQAALATEGIAQAQQTQARAGLLPSLAYSASAAYNPRGNFIAANGVHEYVSQGVVHEDLGLGPIASYQSAQAGLALARAQAEIAARGLNATVTLDYYTLVAASHKLATAQQALSQAQSYLAISQDLERGGEVAHADVIKADIELEQKQNALTQAQLARQQAQLALAVLLFPNFNQNFTVADDLDQPPPLPPEARIQAMAGAHNPALAAAQAALTQARAGVGVARAGLLPSLSLDYAYGIDAPQFARRDAAGLTNLSYLATATVSVPVFDWGANRAKLQQSTLLRQLAQKQLSQTQRQLLADVQGFYAEAEAARSELTALAQARANASESLRLTGLQYRAGDATILELVDAQNTLTLARDAYDDGQVRYRVALAQLQTLTGAF